MAQNEASSKRTTAAKSWEFIHRQIYMYVCTKSCVVLLLLLLLLAFLVLFFSMYETVYSENSIVYTTLFQLYMYIIYIFLVESAFTIEFAFCTNFTQKLLTLKSTGKSRVPYRNIYIYIYNSYKQQRSGTHHFTSQVFLNLFFLFLSLTSS